MRKIPKKVTKEKNNDFGVLTSLVNDIEFIPANKERFLLKAFENIRLMKQSEFYALVCELLNSLGFDAKESRHGDTNNRMDAIIYDNKHSIGIEIKSPTETEYVNIKAIRQALENKIILLSRKWLPTDKPITSLAIGYKIPNKRSEVFELIDDIKNTYDINIGIIGIKTLFELAWTTIIEGKTVDKNKIVQLTGTL